MRTIERIGIRMVLLAGVLMSWSDANAEYMNYFGEEGTEWTVLVESHNIPTLPQEESYYHMWLEGKAEMAGREALKLWKRGEKSETAALVTYVAVEGDKVFFLQRNGTEWCLVYDFGLHPGETSQIYGASILNMATQNNMQASNITCVSVTPLAGNPDFEVMEIEYAPLSHPTDKWIKGIGDMQGVLENDFYQWVGGPGSVITEVKSHGEVVYRYEPSASVESLDGTSGQAVETIITLQGQRVGKRVKGEIYIVGGKKVIYK